MTKIFFILFTIFPLICIAQSDYQTEILRFQKDLNADFKNPEESPLTKKARRRFIGHNFFPIDEAYRVKAKFIRNKKPVSVQMETTTNRLANYDIYATVEFELKGKLYNLTIYQSHSLRLTEEYKDYLFLPFTDLTNGKDTYGGGRYIDLDIPNGDTLVIDFNKAYSPSCAYNIKYSCPITPAANNLPIRVEAGVKILK